MAMRWSSESWTCYGEQRATWKRKMPLDRKSRGISLMKNLAARGLGAYSSGSDLTGNALGTSRGAMPRNVSLFVAISTDEPLFIEPGRMLRNASEVYRFVCSRLLCHRPTALFAIFCRHCFSSYSIWMINRQSLRSSP